MTLPVYLAPRLEGVFGVDIGRYFRDSVCTQMDVTAGTVTASKALVADSNSDLTGLRNLTITGTLSAATLAFSGSQTFPIPQESLRVWDAIATLPVTSGANDDLALVYNTLGTAAPSVESGDSKAASTTRRIGFTFRVPPQYTAGDTVTLRLNAGMKTTVSDGTATIDAEVYRMAAPTVDVCATNAQSINSLTAANKDFTITPTNVVPGDVLDVRITIAIVDSATVTAVIGKWNPHSSGFLLG